MTTDAALPSTLVTCRRDQRSVDGTGYGLDGTIWGGELLLGNVRSFERVGSLLPVALPGGARAVRQPWRMACSWLSTACVGEPRLPAPLAGRVDPSAWAQVHRLAVTGTAGPATTSMGRLFDAVAALTGIRAEINYEGQAAVELEAACDADERNSYPIVVGGTPLVIDPRETIRAINADVRAGAHAGVVARRFHRTIARATVDACAALAAAHGTDVVVLSGGVFQSRLLLGSVSDALANNGLRVLVPERLPVNDAGIAYGQAAVGAAVLT